jgi:hypothetical protein
VKQTLKIAHFFGTSENAVRIQITVPLITYLLIRMAHAGQTAIVELTRFARLVRANVMHRRPLERLRQRMPETEIRPVRNDGQMTLLWA